MERKQYEGKPQEYWDNAGVQGFGQAMYGSSDVERHVRLRLWNMMLEIADQLGIPRSGTVLDYGCGDGAFANTTLAPAYRSIVGYDFSVEAIKRATAEAAGPHVKFVQADVTAMDYSTFPRFDGAFMVGILHHIKQDTPHVLKVLSTKVDKMVVLEPNGSHILRKLLELTPSYRAAGEDSFRKAELTGVFKQNGWDVAVSRRVNLFPNFTPQFIYAALAPLEPHIEKSGFWNALCTVDIYGVRTS